MFSDSSGALYSRNRLSVFDGSCFCSVHNRRVISSNEDERILFGEDTTWFWIEDRRLPGRDNPYDGRMGEVQEHIAERFADEVEKNEYADICEAAEYACLLDGADVEIRERRGFTNEAILAALRVERP